MMRSEEAPVYLTLFLEMDQNHPLFGVVWIQALPLAPISTMGQIKTWVQNPPPIPPLSMLWDI